jgi:hypothetical protein
MRRYRIADFLTDDMKRAACSAVYLQAEAWSRPRTEDGSCPLGVALRSQGFEGALAPDAGGFTRAMTRADPSVRGDKRKRVYDAARSFIAAWDDTNIPPSELPVAIGLTGGDS